MHMVSRRGTRRLLIAAAWGFAWSILSLGSVNHPVGVLLAITAMAIFGSLGIEANAKRYSLEARHLRRYALASIVLALLISIINLVSLVALVVFFILTIPFLLLLSVIVQGER